MNDHGICMNDYGIWYDGTGDTLFIVYPDDSVEYFDDEKWVKELSAPSLWLTSLEGDEYVGPL